MIKTYRGQLVTQTEDRIRLQTIKGKVGYKIVKFQTISATPGVDNEEAVLKIYKTTQSTIDGLVDFTDSDLLGVAFSAASSNTYYAYGTPNVIFDSEIFNQDIFVTYRAVLGSANMNYYLELEVIPLDDAGAEYTTLKDMRST